MTSEAGGRAVDLGGGQSLKLSTKVTVFKRVSLLIVGGKHVDWGGQVPSGPPWRRPCMTSRNNTVTTVEPRA